MEPATTLARLNLHPTLTTGPRFRSAAGAMLLGHGLPAVIQTPRPHSVAMAPALTLRFIAERPQRPGTSGTISILR